MPGDHQRGQERGPCPGHHAGTLGTVPPATEQSLGWKILQQRWPQAGPQMPGVATPSRWPCFPRESRTPSLHTAGEMGLLFISVHSWVTRSQSREKLAPGGPLTITRGHQGPRADRGTCRARARPDPLLDGRGSGPWWERKQGRRERRVHPVWTEQCPK